MLLSWSLDTLRLAATLGMLAGWGWLAWALAVRGWGDAPRASRVAAALTLGVVLPVAWANVLLTTGGFSLATMAVSLPLAAWAGRGPWALLCEDAAALRALAARSVQGRWAWVTVPALLCGGLRFLRGAAAPPLAWDSLTYHLLRAGQWVQAGRHTFLPAPSSWGYYQGYSYGGDRLWAVVMLSQNDVLVPLASTVAWGIVPIVVWALARTVGAARAGAGLAALGVGWAQALLTLQTTAYVDNLVNALTVSTVLFGIRAWTGGRGADAAMLAVAGVAAAATKTSLVPVGAGACVVAAGLMARARVPGRVWLGVVAVLLATALPWWTNTRAFGNPFFPFALRVAGRELLPGDPEMSRLVADTLFGPAHAPRWSELWGHLFFRTPGVSGADATGFGPEGLLLLVVGAVAAWRHRHEPTLRLLTLAGAGVTLLFAQALADPGMRMYLTDWVAVTPRLLAPCFAVVATLAALAPRRWVWPIAIVVAWTHAYFGLPFGASEADLPAAALVAGGGLLLLLPRGVGLLALPLVLGAVPWVQGPDRWAHWLSRDAGGRVAFDLHPLHQFFARAAPAWDHLDQDHPLRIVVVPSITGNGQAAYFYPLLGRHFQNVLTYVPPTIDGSVPDLFDAEAMRKSADEAAWLRRLAAAEPDYVVQMEPDPLEEAWLRARATVFVPEVSPRKPAVTVFRVDPTALAAAVSGDP